MASPTRWTWVWVNSGSWWWTGKPVVVQLIHGVEESDTTELLNWAKLNGLVVFHTFFNFSLNLAIRNSWSEPQTAPGLFFANCIELLHFGWKEYNQSDFSVDHLVMSMYRVFSCVVGRGCLLWPVCSLGKTLLAFVLLHSVLQDQICLLYQVFLDFLILHCCCCCCWC